MIPLVNFFGREAKRIRSPFIAIISGSQLNRSIWIAQSKEF
jgi:hypothetical protein